MKTMNTVLLALMSLCCFAEGIYQDFWRHDPGMAVVLFALSMLLTKD